MSYTVLARRYRSSNFDQVVGQEHIAQTLKRAIDTGRIAHAYLFCGTRGTGKTSTARILAKALNCESSDKPTSLPCDQCASCLAIARGEDMDVIEIDAASNTGVDHVRTLIENAQYRPARSRFKIYIIDEVHMLSKAAFNALLKTMEEPPGHVKFILATTEPEKVLATILSRCQRYDFRNIPTPEIAAHLKSIAKQENIQADDDALLMVAKAGAGSMRDSLSLLDRLLSVGEKNLTLDMIESLLGLPKTQLIFNLAQGIGTGDVKSVLQQTEKLLSSGLSPDTLLVTLVDHLRNLLILRTCGTEAGLVEVPGLPIRELAEQANQFDPTTLTQDITILEELRRLLRQAMASRALLDATFVRLTLADQFSSIAELLSRTDGQPTSPAAQKKKPELTSVNSIPPASQSTSRAIFPQAEIAAPQSSTVNTDLELDDDLPAPGKVWDTSGPSLSELLKQQTHQSIPPASHPESNIATVVPSDLSTIWRSLLAATRENDKVSAFLKPGRLVGFEDDGDVAIISADSLFARNQLERNGKKDIIRDALCKILNKPIGLRIISDESAAPAPAAISPNPPSANPAPQAASSTAANPAHRVIAEAPPPMADNSIRLTPELRDQLRQDPLIKSVLETLGGDIIKLSID